VPLPRPHPLARAQLVDRLNAALDNSWRRGWLSEPTLDPGELWDKAARGFAEEDEQGGRSEEDARDFRQRLDALSAALRDEAQLNPLGRTMAHGQMVRAIRQRLALGRMWRDRPELLRTPFAPPILVVGQMRAGTTRLHRLLAADPAHAATRFCDSWHPVPSRFDTRPILSGFALFMARRIDPWIDTLHPFGAARHDEELGWLASALDHSTYEAQWRIPSYVALGESRDPSPVWREFARILRTDAAHRRNGHLPRVMKVPQFSEQLDPLLAQFPGARVVLAERADAAVIRSSASLVANQMTIQSDDCDMSWIEAEWTRKIALRHSRTEAALRKFAGKVATADFDRLSADWSASITDIYRQLGLDHSEAAQTAMTREMRLAANSPHVGHAAQLDSFGHDPDWAGVKRA